MSIPRIDIGIACSAHQIPNWWAGLFSEILRELDRGTFELGQLLANQSALREWNKNQDVGGIFAPPTENKRNGDTDANRQSVTGSFLTGSESGIKSDWIFWVDDDTVPGDGAITSLLRLDKPFVAGLYFNTNPPYNPIAYKRLDNGGYQHLWDYAPGSILEVDSVGMGCTLIHRSVYEKIMEEHVVFQRTTGSLFPIHKSLIYKTLDPVPSVAAKKFVQDGWYYEKVVTPEDTDNRFFPFYSMEYGRTEDHHFCEMACDVGIHPWVDTNIVCEHWKHSAGNYDQYQKEVTQKEVVGKMVEDED